MSNALNIKALAVETDTKLADLYNTTQALGARIDSNAATLKHMAGARFYYRGKRRVTDMATDEAIAIVRDALDALDAWKADHSVTEADGWVRTDWVGYVGRIRPHEQDNANRALNGYDEANAMLAATYEAMREHEAVFAEHRWSRFFLVTSSQGHIHSSMHCSTCRPTTTYGWLPQLSGSTEAEAVEAHGPALCSVCFASAPVEWVGGKLTKAQAERAAH